MGGFSGKLANKFLGLGAAIAFAMALLIVPLVDGYNSQIAVAEKERSGIAVHRELRQVFQEVQRHRGASTSQLSGKDGFKERAEKARNGTDAAVAKVDVVMASQEAQLGKIKGWDEFKSQWQNLKTGFTNLKPAENVKQHNAVIASLLAVMDQAADVSGLVLDPSLDSHYTMDMVVIQLPPVTERMGQGRALGAVILSDKSLSQEQRDAMIGNFAEMRQRDTAIRGDGEKIFTAKPALRERLKPAFDQAAGGMALFISSVEQNILKPETLTYEPARYFDETTKAIDATFGLYDEGVKALDDILAARIGDVKNSRLTVLLIVGCIIGIVALLAVVILRRVNRAIVCAADALDQIAAGCLDVQLKAESKDETGHLIEQLDNMQKQLRDRLGTEHRLANENLRIKVALDVGSNSVMVADPEGKIVYCNAAVLNMMRQAESGIRKQLPNFRADGILGSNFDIYHKNPVHQRNLLAGLKSSYHTEMEVGDRHFALVATPIVNAQGERLGTAVEWRDRTAEVSIERDVADIINAAVAGDFTKRLDAVQMSGFFKHLSQGINSLLDANSRALGDIGAMLNRLAQGDLTRIIDTEYQGTLGQLKDDANSTIANLKEIIRSIKGATDAINTAAKEIAAGNQDLSSRTEEQASSLEETASSMEQLTGTVKQNADNAKQASELAGSAQQVAVRGGEVVGQVVQTMSAIHQSSSKIADIIGVIDGIAFQTNILALNAAVEAARAGEQGRGFAVVATEVRNLAQRSAAAAKEIKGLISDSVDKVETGSKLVDQAGRTMGEVVASIKRVAHIMSDISEASREQSSGIEQVSLAVSQMDEVTQQNAALVEEAAAAAESLEEQAHTLSRAVSVFTLGDEGERQPMSASQSAAARLAVPKRETARHSAVTKPQSPSLVSREEDEWEEF